MHHEHESQNNVGLSSLYKYRPVFTIAAVHLLLFLLFGSLRHPLAVSTVIFLICAVGAIFIFLPSSDFTSSAFTHHTVSAE